MSVTISGTTGVSKVQDGAVVYDDLATEVKTVVGRKNLIINGAMQVAQRGTQAVGGSTGLHYGGCDRWRVYQENTATAYTLSQDSNAPSGSGFASSLKVDITTADATADAPDRIDLIYRFEGQDLQQLAKGTSDAKQMSLSFWVSSPKTGTHIVELYDVNNNRHVSAFYTISTADTWEKKTIAIPADTTGALTNDNNLSLQVSWWLLAGSNYSSGTLNTSWAASTSANRAVGQVNIVDSTANNFYITGVQLEVGSVATDFEHRSYGEELALCQRYYWKMNAGSAYSSFGYAGAETVNNIMIQDLTFPVEMRTIPTLGYSALTDFNIYTLGATLITTPTAITIVHPSNNITRIQFTKTATFTDGNMYFVLANNTTNAYLDFSAEL